NPLLISSAFAWENGMATPVLIYKKTAWKISYESGVLNIRLLCNVVPDDALIRFIQFDEENGTLFLGTDSKGIIIIRQNKVKSLRKTRVSVNERTSYYSQLELPDGNILTNEGHILGENKPGNFTYPGLQRFSISSYLMNDTVFWYTSFNKEFNGTFLHSYNLKTKKITIYSKVRENYSQLVMTTHSGVLYLANEFGISRLQGDSLLMLYRYDKVSRSNIHFDIKETAPGILTLASCNALTRFDISTGKLDTIFVPGNYCVRTLWQYKDYLFFGTYGNGLYISKGGVVKALPLDKNKYLLFTHCFVDDKNGFCWISTNHGLFKASIQDMISAYEQTAPQVYYHYFGRNDGMNMTEMNGGCLPCALMMKNGTISFPTMEGLLWVKPNAAAPVMPGGEIYIDKIIVDNKNADVAAFEQTTLSPRKHDLELRLGFSAWCNKENIYLEYSLGDNKEWRQINENNEAVLVLNNLSPGDYLLRIRKLNGFGPNNYSYKELRFRIGTPWYQKWWFYLGCVVFIAGLILIYLNFRTRQYKSRQLKLEQQVADKTRELQEQNQVLEKNNSIKTRLISIISHDIVTPLKFLNAAGKNLMEKRKIMPDELQQETIQEITNTSQELQLLSTNILNWIKYQNENRRLAKEVFNLHELVEQVLGILQSLARQKNLVIKNEIAGSQEINQYYEPIKILVYNLLTNAIQFTEKGVIAVNASQNGNKLTLSVKDEGIGMTAEQVQRILADEVVITAANVDNKKGHGLGYLIIKDLLKTVGASLQINSKRGWGTTVSITMNA
ncbi:MAG TPA: ATP-binding protein, partial [Chitinophagaceae bacterium]|nr:ATP-binding protein [Chitinophagaceae bacterium]